MNMKKTCIIGVIVILLGAQISSNIGGSIIRSDTSLKNIETDTSYKIKNDNNEQIYNDKGTYFYSRPQKEKPKIEFSEIVTFLDDDMMYLSIEIMASSVSLVNLYKESFGIPLSETHIDMEVPINATRVLERNLNDEITIKEVIEPVREKFYEGISEEQKYLFGFHIQEFIGTQIKSDTKDKIKICADALAVPYISNVEYGKSLTTYKISSAPSDIVNDYLYAQMDITHAMLYSMPNANTLEKIWDVELILPSIGELGYVETKNDFQKFEGGASLESKVSLKSSTSVCIYEKLKITDRQLSRDSINVDQFFKVEYTVSTSNIKYDNFNYFSASSDYDVYNFGPWDESWDLLSLHYNIEGEHGYVDCWLNVTIYLILEGTVFVDVGATKMKAETTITAGVNASVHIKGALEWTFSLDLGLFKGRGFDWCGSQPLVITPFVEPTAEVRVEVGGEIFVWVNPEVTFEITAGGDVDFNWGWPPVKFTPIFEFIPGGSFTMGYVLDVYVKVRPALGCAFSVLVFGIVGPRVNPELYLEGILGYSSEDGVYWHAELGFDLMVGLQLTPFLHWDWPDPIVHIILAEWDSENDPDAGNPADTNPPITKIHMRPLENGFAGWDTNFWFEAKDDGADASGLDRTMYNIPIEHGYGEWKTFNYDTSPMLMNYPEYDIQYYSVDVADNYEPPQTETIYPDLNPPTSVLSVGETPIRDEIVVYAEQTPITIEASDNHTGYQIFYTTWNESIGWGNWRNGSKNESVTHYFPFEDQGTCFIYWFTVDGAGNFEKNQSEVFYVTTPPSSLLDIKMCEYIGGPEVTEFNYGQECFCEIEVNNAVEGEIVTWMWKLNDQIRYVDNTVVTSSTCWNSWTPDLSGEWIVEIFYDYVYKGSSELFAVIEGPEASLEDTIMCEYAGGPEITEFDFDQNCYSYCEFDNIQSGDIVKWKWIWDVDGNVKYTTEKTITGPSIWCSWIPAFSGDWHIDIYYNDVYVGSGETFIVKEPEFPKGLITEFTVFPNPVEYNGNFTAIVAAKNIGNVSGYFMVTLETDTHGVLTSDVTELIPGDTMMFQGDFGGITQSTYCNATLWWLDNYILNIESISLNSRDQILHDEEQIFVSVASQDTIGEINFTASIFYTGPFHNEEKGRKIAIVKIKNIGTHTGVTHIKLFEYLDSPDENPIFSKNVLLNPDEEYISSVWIDISDGPEEGLWPLGLKVWGETESEPTWEQINNTYSWNIQIIEPHEPRITTMDATNIKDTNMVLYAYLNDDGGEPCTCGFWYGITYPLNETSSQNVTCDETITTSETCHRYINDLTPGYLYYVKSWTRNLKGFQTSDNTLSFHTISPDAVPPTVITNSTIENNETSVTLNGFLFDDGGEPCTCGFWYGTSFPIDKTNSQNLICNEDYISGDSFNKTISIQPSKTYYVCSWASNSKGFFVSNKTHYCNEFGDYSYTFTISNINLGDDIPYTHSIEFPMSIWTCNRSISINDSVENFLNQGEIFSNSSCVFQQNTNKNGWISWKKWRYENGLDNTLNNIEPLTNYNLYIDETDLPATINFKFDMYTLTPYDIIYPSSIWVFNNSIKQNDSCENFCKQGGIWEDIDMISHPSTGNFWKKGGSYNTLTTLTYGEHYRFWMENKSEISFVYDEKNYDDFGFSMTLICGDANGDEAVNVGDAVYIINYVFKGGPPPNPLCSGDANGDTQVDVGDAVYLIQYLFKGGPPPVSGCCD